jgi:hypothetical protein
MYNYGQGRGKKAGVGRRDLRTTSQLIQAKGTGHDRNKAQQ